MNNCIICDIINNPTELEDTILFENKDLIVKAAKGMVVPGHLLIIPKKHINGFAELSIDELKKIEVFYKKIKNDMKSYLNKNVIIFEHGSLPEGRHPKSIVHAHLHIIPYNLSNNNHKRIISSCQLKEINDYLGIKNVEKKDYCYYEYEDEKCYLSDSVDFPRSIIFKIIAEQEGIGYDYEWRDNHKNDKNNLIKTFEIAKNILNKK